eukprot:m.114664 g.114664  ORF g.114664 m.114664 type:complete len:342 (-) comp28362_c1_seq2:270-1295(-)
MVNMMGSSLIVVLAVGVVTRAQHSLSLPDKYTAVETECNKLSTSTYEAALAKSVEKKAFSDTYRVAFFAGVGGTGHHMWANITKDCEDINHVCREAPWRKRLWIQHSNNDMGLFSGYTKYPLHRVYCKMKSHVEAAEDMRTKTEFTLDVANTIRGEKTGMMSYPNFWQGYKGNNQPDINVLAHLTEELGLDFRVVIMLRHPWSQLSSVRKRFGKGRSFRQFAKAFGTTQKALLDQIKNIHPKFYTCVVLDDIVEYGPAVDKLFFDGVRKPGGPLLNTLPSFNARISQLVDRTRSSAYSTPEAFEERVLKENKYYETFNEIQKLCAENTMYGMYKPIIAEYS